MSTKRRASRWTGFDAWLKEQGYRPQTAELYQRTVDRAENSSRRPQHDYEFAAFGRLADFLEGHGRHEEAARARESAKRPERTRVARRRMKQHRTSARSTSIPEQDWRKLSLVLQETSTPEARVLEVMSATGLRVGDLLSVRREALSSAIRAGTLRLETKGGEPRILPMLEEWRSLWSAWRADEKRLGISEGGWWPTVGAWLCRRPGGRSSDGRDEAGYRRLARALKDAADEAEVSGRVHLHRLRRTVAVQALRSTRDTATVQQLLGHRSITTTMSYLDEARPDDIRDVSENLRTLRRKNP